MLTRGIPVALGVPIGEQANTVAVAMAGHDLIGTPIDSQPAWEELIGWLPGMLEQLLASAVYGIDGRPPRDQRGLYLFTENGNHLYVGRTGISVRARARGGTPITSFRHRFDQHTQPGRPPGASSFAHRLMLQRAFDLGIHVPSEWWTDRDTSAANIYAVYRQMKERIGAMECRVVGFVDDVKGVRSTVAEVYAHAQLGTLYNDFSTS
jgi:hypothetical protein